MNPRICPAGTDHRSLFLGDFLQAALKNLLNGDPVRLDLPPVIGTPFEFNKQLGFLPHRNS
jgi:hypothetical protein